MTFFHKEFEEEYTYDVMERIRSDSKHTDKCEHCGSTEIINAGGIGAVIKICKGCNNIQ